MYEKDEDKDQPCQEYKKNASQSSRENYTYYLPEILIKINEQ
jgi:hypothetical protein